MPLQQELCSKSVKDFVDDVLGGGGVYAAIRGSGELELSAHDSADL